MLGMTFKEVKIAFNQETIMTPAEKMLARTRREFGAYTRTIMKNSIKAAGRKGEHSRAGQPPLHHNGPIDFKDTIFFVDDPRAKECVIGAVLLDGTAAGGTPVPGNLEHGAVIVPTGKMLRYHKKPITIEARPYAKPAFDKAISKKLPDLIAGGVMREV